MPFAAAVRAGTLAVMTSHVLLPALDADRPATLSPAVLGLLRGELGFDGLLVSDALDMAGASAGRGEPAAAVLALAAGCDLLCLGADKDEAAHLAVLDAIVEAVKDGSLPEARLAEAAGRVVAASRTVRGWHRPDGSAEDDPGHRGRPAGAAGRPRPARPHRRCRAAGAYRQQRRRGRRAVGPAGRRCRAGRPRDGRRPRDLDDR